MQSNTYGNSPSVEWRYIPLNSGNKPPRGCTLKTNPEYWEGAPATVEALAALVVQRRGVGLLTYQSGLVILDCDVTLDFIKSDSHYRMVERHGLTDLLRLAGEENEQLPPTRVVQTPSGGLHLYYAQNPHLQVTSKGHRDGWLIDVKASRNTWVVAPPTPGYTVIRDLPVAVLPYWLALRIQRINRTNKPTSGTPGGTSGGTLPAPPGVDGHDEGLYTAWLHTITDWVSEANDIAARNPHGKGGDWGNRIFQAARLMSHVVPDDEADTLILSAAAPWNEHEEKAAHRHIINGRAWAQQNESGVSA